MRVRGKELFEAEHAQHFACFACRKAFKQRGSGHPSWNESLRSFPCPDCKSPMVPMGRDFKAPPCRAKAQWLKVELLQSFGVIFEVPVLAPGGPGKRPSKLQDAIPYLVMRGFAKAKVERRLKELRRHRSDTDGRGEPEAAADGGRDLRSS
jgi:hypothetical protein